MKNKYIFILALILALSLCLTACAEDVGADVTPSVAPTQTDNPTTTTPPEPSQSPDSGSAEDSESEQGEPEQYELEFDFYEAVQNIYLFGHKISLPCTIEDFGDDFSLDEEGMLSDSEYNLVVVSLCYKDNIIGNVILQDCELEDEDKNTKQIDVLVLGDSYKQISTYDGWYKDIIQVDILGISFQSSREDVRNILGTPAPYEGVYYDTRLVYEKSEYEYIQMKFLEGKMVEFFISVTGVH